MNIRHGIPFAASIGGDVLDTYAGVAQLLEFDIHYQLDSLGSEEAYSKA